MSALPPKADMCSATRDVRFGPIADIVPHSVSSWVDLFLCAPCSHVSRSGLVAGKSVPLSHFHSLVCSPFATSHNWNFAGPKANMKTQIVPALSGSSRRASVDRLMLQKRPQIITQHSRGFSTALKSCGDCVSRVKRKTNCELVNGTLVYSF
jgi:hypothetical protein